MIQEAYAHTELETVEPTRLAELRALAKAALAGTLRWRHHAIGALQAYLVEDAEPEVRIHIWHPQLVLASVERDGGRAHDHRFALCSTVLAGSVGHEEIDVTPDADGDLVEYTVQHARAGAAPLAPTGARLRATRRTGVVAAGQRYTFAARRFHRSFVPELAVTLVSKLKQETAPARVLFPYGAEPSFGVTSVDAADAAPYVSMAIWSLGNLEAL